MDSHRKQQILAAQNAFVHRERLKRTLAASGIYALGPIHSALQPPSLTVRLDPRETDEAAADDRS